MTIADLLQRLHDHAYTGRVVLHFAQGVAQAYEQPAAPVKLDKPPRSAYPMHAATSR